ncbi:epoxide hydrolase [Pyrenochaeta sp. MPI-SDFR-AT-0127]|nr:epoxide hydrolase [Pyrenochaeta sp. MPI-SDFR-AT-0127]
MESLQRKTLVTCRELKYTYFVSLSTESTQDHPVLLFIHGFPDSAHLWSALVAKLRGLRNKIIIPDCLGYAGTDKPEDPTAYAFIDQAKDLVDILQHENAKSTVIIGHDWGSALAQRTYLHHRELISGMVLLNTGYMVPQEQPFDLAAVNTFSAKTLGYPQFAYWEFLIAADASSIVEGNLERMWQVMHGDVEDWMRKLFCVRNAMRDFLVGNDRVPLKDYANQLEWKDTFMTQFQRDGFASALQMYKATTLNIQYMSDSTIPKDKLAIEVPILFFLCNKDAVCTSEMMTEAKRRGLVPDLKEVVLECAHWSPMENPNEIAKHIKEFILDRFSCN